MTMRRLQRLNTRQQRGVADASLMFEMKLAKEAVHVLVQPSLFLPLLAAGVLCGCPLVIIFHVIIILAIILVLVIG